MFDVEKGFLTYIVGRRGMGKSYLLIQMLLHKDLLKDKFDEVFLVNPNYEFDPKYHIIKFTEVYTEYSNELMQEMIETFKETHDKKRLIIFDDCISEQEFKKVQNDHPMNELANLGRHWGVSMIILSQKYNAISTTIRAQLDYLILFQIKNHAELDTVYKEFGIGSKNDFYDLIQSVYQNQHDTLMINNIDGQYYHNFNVI
jgi:KaiC/GvpD/RAD55 family RecA-like ATPase